MKRLRDSDAQSELMRKAQALIDAAPSDEASAERVQRIRRALDRPRAGLGWRRAPALVLAGLVGLFGASAFAAVRVFEMLQPAAQPAPERPAAHPAARRGKRAAQPGAPVPEAEPAALEAAPQALAPGIAAAPGASPALSPAPEDAPVLVAPGAVPIEGAGASVEPPAPRRVAPARAHPARRAGTHRAAPAAELARTPATPVPAAEPTPAQTQAIEQRAAAHDSELVHRAVRALRRDRDPALAARLLEQNRVKNPSGPLAEEALSLQIEAAMALRSLRASDYAREYLNRYPAGRYAAVARRALADAAR